MNLSRKERGMRLADRYIFRNHVGPFFLGLSILTFVLMVDIVVDLLELFLVNDVPILVVLELIGLSFGHVLALTIPMAVLVATLLAFSQMEAENEITALRSGGTSLYRIILAPLIAAILLTAFMFIYNDQLLPRSNHKLKNLLSDIRRKKPALALEPGRFITDIPGYSLYIREKNEATGKMEGVWIFEEKSQQGPQIISARRGRLESGSGRELRLYLEDGDQFQVDLRNRSLFQLTSFQRMEMVLEDVNRDLRRREGTHKGDREMGVKELSERVDSWTLENRDYLRQQGELGRAQLGETLGLLDPELRREWLVEQGFQSKDGGGIRRASPHRLNISSERDLARDLRNKERSMASNEKKILKYSVEYHKKYAIPFACFIFILLGAPVSIKMGRSGRSWGIAFAIALFATYYAWITGGEQLADRRLLSPWAAMWVPNLSLSLLGAWLLYWTNRESRPFTLLTRISIWWEERKGMRT